MYTGFVKIVLIEPEIPPNTGTIARLCAATNTELILVGMLGFSLDDKYLKRAGLDYWDHVQWQHILSIDEFLDQTQLEKRWFLSKKVHTVYTDVRFTSDDYLIFGSETKGLSDTLLETYANRCLTIPMPNPHIRSLNLANAASIVLYEAMRQQTIVQEL